MAQSTKPWAGQRTAAPSALAREYSKPSPARVRDTSWDISPEEDMPELVTAAEASRLIGCSHGLIGSWVTRGKLASVAYRVNEGGERRYRLFRSRDLLALHERAMLDKRYRY